MQPLNDSKFGLEMSNNAENEGDTSERQRQLAVQIVLRSPPTQLEVIQNWAGSLLNLRARNLSALEKAKEAVRITFRAKVIWPILKALYAQVKRRGWDDRTASQRLGIGVAATAFAMFGGANAGIAALGGAIAVPLWIVFGAGAMFARHLYEEATTQLKSGKSPEDIDINL